MDMEKNLWQVKQFLTFTRALGEALGEALALGLVYTSIQWSLGLSLALVTARLRKRGETASISTSN